MNNVLSLYNDLNALGVKFYCWDLDGERAATLEMNGQYGVFMDFSNIRTLAEELVVVAHEGGHICTGATHKVSSPYDLIAKHEYKTNKWAVEKCISEEDIKNAIAKGHTEIWDLAEYFGVTEDFMKMAVCWYKNGNLAVDMYF